MPGERGFAPAIDQGSAESRFARLRFIAEDSKLTMRNVSLAANLSSLLYLFFSLIDRLIYPDYWRLFQVFRIAGAGSLLVIGFCARADWARRRYRFFATLVPLVSAFFICLMVFVVDDPGTPFYAGLNLCIVGTGTLFRRTSREAALTSVIIFGMYIIAVTPHFLVAEDPSFRYFLSNCLFIVSTAFLVVVAVLGDGKVHYREFLTRTKLRKNQAALEEKHKKFLETLRTLHETERQLFQSEKMSFYGQLSAGVIHEIGNPLNYVNQALFVLKKQLPSGPGREKLDEMVSDAQEGINRIMGIVRDLREFSHHGKKTGEPFLMRDCIDAALRILSLPIAESGVHVSQCVVPEIKAFGVKNQITQVLTNLIHNSIQAMTGQNNDQEKHLRISARLDGGQVLVEVSDTGPGIPTGIRNSVFDPFFTTKEPGKGCGLGLSIAYRIVEAHGGTIEIKDSPNQTGTTFFMKIPCPRDEAIGVDLHFP